MNRLVTTAILSTKLCLVVKVNARLTIEFSDFPTLRTERLMAVLEFGFLKLNLHTVSATINPLNNASRQLLLRHGFVKEAYFRQDYYFKGEFLDSEVYGLINPDQ